TPSPPTSTVTSRSAASHPRPKPTWSARASRKNGPAKPSNPLLTPRLRAPDPPPAEPMPVDLLATCWTHAGDAMPVAGRHLSPLDLRARAEAVAAAGFTGIGFTINDLEAAKPTYGLPQVKRICEDL